ncbi:UNVERIFIED_CONTAM: hypothetical protein Sangu_1313900 [Sesamum angustifolium]|uniref:Transposase (putative) gypsy type domain-containing protein n=1 Tax=Sesamum angustifolium TaxID=2727405 RepID=A0AAW2NKC7_9LAMI
MSSIDESIRYMAENLGEDSSEATSKRSRSHPPSSVGGRRWSLHQAACCLLDESLMGEDDKEEEDSGERNIDRSAFYDNFMWEERGLPGTRRSRPSGSMWVAYCLRQSDIYQLVEEFGILPEFEVSVPPSNSHPSSSPLEYMSFFASKLRAGLRFPLPSFLCDISREFQVPLNQLAPNSVRLLVAFFMVLQYNNFIPNFRVFSHCFQLKRIEPGVFHFALGHGMSFLPTPSPPKRWKGDFFFILPSRSWNVPHRWIYDSPPTVPFSLVDRSSNLCAFLNKLNEKSYDCKELTEEIPEPLWSKPTSCAPARASGDIMFSKYLKDEHKAVTTPPTTRPGGEGTGRDGTGREGAGRGGLLGWQKCNGVNLGSERTHTKLTPLPSLLSSGFYGPSSQ